jgi:hypothetical protein
MSDKNAKERIGKDFVPIPTRTLAEAIAAATPPPLPPRRPVKADRGN